MKAIAILLCIIILVLSCVPYIIVFSVIQSVRVEPLSFIVSVQCQLTGWYCCIKFYKWFISKIK